jgi:ABC-type antimicrobial peptide transport system permease subunit
VFRTPVETMLIALGAAIALGVVAGALPAWSASRLKVTDALRRVN